MTQWAVWNVTRERWVDGSQCWLPSTAKILAEQYAAQTGDKYEVRKYLIAWRTR